MSDYAKPDVLVDTDWVEAHGDDDAVRLIEVDEDTAAYDKGHIEGAVGWNWTTDLHTKVGRDYVSQAELAAAAVVGRCRAGHDRRPVRRQQQLVRRVRVLDPEAPWFRQRQAAERRAQEVGARVASAHAGRADATRPPASRSRVPTGPEIRAWRDEVISKIGSVGPRRRPLSGGVPGREARARPPAAGAVAGARARPGRGEHPVGEGRERRRNVQVRRRAPRALRGRGHHRRPRGDRVLPDRRAFVAHVVRAAGAARVTSTSRTTTARGPSTARSWARRSRSAETRPVIRSSEGRSGPAGPGLPSAATTRLDFAAWGRGPGDPASKSDLAWAAGGTRAACSSPGRRSSPDIGVGVRGPPSSGSSTTRRTSSTRSSGR